jgi:hypothetical protein
MVVHGSPWNSGETNKPQRKQIFSGISSKTAMKRSV